MLYQLKPRPRGGAILPAGFIVPCQAVLAHKVPLGPEWIHELKHDGFRLIVRKEAGRVKLWTRPGLDWTDRFDAIREAAAHLPDGCVLDGEATVDSEAGGYDFHALRSKAGCARATLWAFDLLFDRGGDIRPSPLEERRDRLRDLVGEGRPGMYFSGHIEGPDGQKMFDLACEANLEGIVSKRKGSRYRSGPYDAWRKIKCKDYRRV
jgi:bifunctional non-homologous end joining protein LigD